MFILNFASRFFRLQKINPVSSACIFAFFLFMGTVGGGYYIYLHAQQALLATVQQFLLAVANSASRLTAGDAHQLIIDPNQKGDNLYRQVQEPYLQLLQSHTDLAYIYTLIEKDQQYYFIIDTQQPNNNQDDDTADVMELYTDMPVGAVEAIRRQIPQVDLQPTSDKWGTFLSAYAPIYNSTHQLLGVVGVDLRMENYQHKLINIRNSLYLLFFLGFLAASALGFLIHAAMKRSLRANARLVESEQRFRLIADSMPNLLWMTDANDHYTFINKPWLEFTGSSMAELLTEGWSNKVHVDDMPFFINKYQVARQADHSFQRWYRLLRHDGEYRWMLDVGMPRKSADGRYEGFIGACTDITERKQFEEELRRHRDNLQVLVAEQTKSLVAQKDKAEKANQAKSEFLSNMSHELRTPMHAVLNYANIGLEQVDTHQPELLKKYFRNIHLAGDRLLNLINNLLDLAKLEAGKMQFTFESNEFLPIVEYAAMELESLLQAKQLDLVIESTLNRAVMLDKSRMIQVLVNLLSNAIKFSPPQSKIQIQLHEIVDDAIGEALCCRILDEGNGIPLAELQSIFEKFMQSTKTQTGAGGTGLGLAISQEIIEAHGGKIFAENSSIKGAIFTLILPFNTH